MHLVLAPSDSDGRDRLDWAQTDVCISDTWKMASIEKTILKKQSLHGVGSAYLLNSQVLAFRKLHWILQSSWI